MGLGAGVKNQTEREDWIHQDKKAWEDMEVGEKGWSIFGRNMEGKEITDY